MLFLEPSGLDTFLEEERLGSHTQKIPAFNSKHSVPEKKITNVANRDWILREDPGRLLFRLR